MLRRLFTLLSALSLLLCVATAVMWVRSYRVGDTYVWLPPARVKALQIGHGLPRYTPFCRPLFTARHSSRYARTPKTEWPLLKP